MSSITSRLTVVVVQEWCVIKLMSGQEGIEIVCWEGLTQGRRRRRKKKK
jgi:hypothetical protein